VEIFAAQGVPPVLLTPVANGKIFNQKNFKYFIWTPLGSKVVNFCLEVQVCSLIFFPYFATSINNNSETGQNLLPVLLIPVAILPPVSLIPVVHLD
jgi:hypothetical protein